MGDHSSPDHKGSTIAILGCGALGTAILSGLLASSDNRFTRFIACVRRDEVAKSIRSNISSHHDVSSLDLHILTRENLRGMQMADVAILACQPHLMREALADAELCKALQGKLLVSVLAGVSEEDIRAALMCNGVTCHIICAMPNTASEVGESMTVITEPAATVPRPLVEIADYIFTCVGVVRHIQPALMSTCTTLCGSTPAFFALILEAMVDSAVAMGLRRSEAVEMAAQAMRGTASLVLSGQQPVDVKNGVTSPGGSTIVGVLKLEEGGLRTAMSRALVATKAKAEVLGGDD